MNNRKKTLLWIWLFLSPSLLVFLLFYTIPILTVFITGFSHWDGFNSFSFAGAANYIKLITYDNTFLLSLRNFLIWGLIAVTLHVGFGTLIAFLLYRKPFGWRFVRSVFMIPNIISLAAWAMIYKFIFNDDIGLINNFIRALGFQNFHVKWFFESPFAFTAVTLTWVFYAVYVTLIVLTDLMAIPEELHEAAKIDGASLRQIVWNIDLPLIKNAVGTGIILSVTARIAMFESISLTTRGGPGHDTYNLPLMVYDGIVNYEFGYANAASTVMILMGVLVMWFVSRIFRMNRQLGE